MNNKNKKKMGFLRINTWQAALMAIIGAMIFVIITANISNSSSVNTDAVAEAKETNSNVINLTDANFQNTIKNGVTLVDFWAVWCGPCRIQGPIIEEVANEIGDKATIAKLDVDRNTQTSTQYGIRNIPTILIFKDGKIVQTFVGVKNKEVLVNAIKQHLGN